MLSAELLYRELAATTSARLAGPAADVLLVLMRRVSPADRAVQVSGDAGLLDGWLQLAAL